MFSIGGKEWKGESDYSFPGHIILGMLEYKESNGWKFKYL